MANANKAKGDRAERSVRDWATARWPGSFKTRAGFNEDLGDIVAATPAGRLVLQVKDVASPAWSAWFTQLAAQVSTLRCESQGDVEVLGGVIVHKLRGKADPAKWRAVATLEDMASLVDRAYSTGLEHGREDGQHDVYQAGYDAGRREAAGESYATGYDAGQRDYGRGLR